MKRQPDSSRRSGTFRVAQGREVNGTLSLAGLNTSLDLWDDKPFDIGQSSGTTITGVLNDLTKVSLFKCVITAGRRRFGSRGTLHTCRLAPHYVVFGERHFADEGCDVHEISFTFDDAKVLFHDTSAYGVVTGNRQLLEQIVRLDNPNREIAIRDDWNWVLYYTGKTEIFSSSTAIGRVSALHSSYVGWDISANPEPESDVFVNIKFDRK